MSCHHEELDQLLQSLKPSCVHMLVDFMVDPEELLLIYLLN